MFSIFKNYSNLILALSQRKDGDMRLKGESFIEDQKVLLNRKKFLEKMGIALEDTVAIKCVHGNKVKIVTERDKGKVLYGVDGLITKSKNLFLTQTVADCLPIFIYDPKREIISLIHAGWRGLANNILSVAIKQLIKKFKSKPTQILVGIGPGICQRHFEVKSDVAEKFKSFKSAFFKKEGKIFLDLKEVAKLNLINLGIKKEKIEISQECTFCLKRKYFSFRRERNPKIPAMLAVFGMV